LPKLKKKKRKRKEKKIAVTPVAMNEVPPTNLVFTLKVSPILLKTCTYRAWVLGFAKSHIIPFAFLTFGQYGFYLHDIKGSYV
jgi:hypothetical protein